MRPRLLALARKELIRPDRAEFAGEDAFRFRHLLIRDAAYQAMPKEQRAELHEGFARWLTDVAGDQVGEYQEILGHHLEQAYRYRSELGPADDRTRALARDAARALHASAERAVERGDLPGAMHLLERAIELADGLDRARAIVDLGEILESRGDYARSIEVLGGFLGSPEASEAPGLRIRADVFTLVSVSQMEPEHGIVAGHERSAALLAEAEALGDDDAITTALLGVSTFAFWRGRCAEALAVSERLLPRVGQLNGALSGTRVGRVHDRGILRLDAGRRRVRARGADAGDHGRQRAGPHPMRHGHRGSPRDGRGRRGVRRRDASAWTVGGPSSGTRRR